jgi:hypothetical protein
VRVKKHGLVLVAQNQSVELVTSNSGRLGKGWERVSSGRWFSSLEASLVSQCGVGISQRAIVLVPTPTIMSW